MARKALWRRAVIGPATCLLAVAVASVPVDARTTTSVVGFTEAFIDPNWQAEIHSTQVILNYAAPTAAYFSVGDPAGASFTVAFQAPPGSTTLAVGTYENTSSSLSPPPGRARFVLSAYALACGDGGRFIVDEITFGSDGNPQSFSARFEVACGYFGPGDVTSGAISYNATAPYRRREVSANTLTFGATALGSVSASLPLTITNHGPATLQVSKATVEGLDASQFSITSTTCGGAMSAGSSCAVSVAFTPSGSVANRSATVVLRDEITPDVPTSRGRPVNVAGRSIPALPSGWSSLGGTAISDIGVATNGPFLYAFAVAINQQLSVWQMAENTWQPGQTVGGYLAAVPTAAARGPYVYVFSASSAGELIYRTIGGGFGVDSFVGLGGRMASNPAAVTHADTVNVFAVGLDGAMWTQQLIGASWSGWMSLGGIVISDLAVVSTSSGLFVFGIGADTAVWYQQLTDVGWSGWQSLGGIATSLPSVAADTNGVHVFARGGDYGLWYRTLAGGSWGPWIPRGGILISPPEVVASPSGLLAFAVGTDLGVWYQRFSGGSWTAWTTLGGVVASFPAAASHESGVHVFAVGTDGALWDHIV